MLDSPARPKLPERFEVQRLLGSGFLGSSWLVLDKATDQMRVARVIQKSRSDPDVDLYNRHLQHVMAAIPAGSGEHMLLPIEIGETDDFYYQIFEYMAGLETLEHAITRGLSSEEAFRIFVQIATALNTIHSRGVVHSDIKPSNVLLQRNGSDLKTFIVDFGMAKAENGDSTFIVGTYAYLPPHEIGARTAVGPYIDIYAAGVVLWEMLTGSRDRPMVLSEQTLATVLATKVDFSSRELLATTARLVHQMLSVKTGQANITAESAASVAQIAVSKLSITRQPAQQRYQPQMPIGTEHEIIQQLRALAAAIVELTNRFVAADGVLKSIATPSQEAEAVADIEKIFDHAIGRTRIAWRLGLIMSVAVFVLLSAMVATTLTLAVITGRIQWALIFGGTTLSMIIGVMIWKPYEQVFRAAVLTQQIEMIHVQTVGGFRGTTVVEKRIEICTSAIDQLSILLRGAPTKTQKRRQSTSRGRSGRPQGPSPDEA